MARLRPMQLRGPVLKGWVARRLLGRVKEGESHLSGRKEVGEWKLVREWFVACGDWG